jgi:broad specificity phosphatase PhoE
MNPGGQRSKPVQEIAAIFMIISTPRLRLRCWSHVDRPVFAAMHADPEVMHDYGGPISRAESDAKLARYMAIYHQPRFLALGRRDPCGRVPRLRRHHTGRPRSSSRPPCADRLAVDAACLGFWVCQAAMRNRGVEGSQISRLFARQSHAGPMPEAIVSTVYFITHPDIVIDPAVPVPEWPLSERGRARMKAMLEQDWIPAVRAIYCSTERKAIDGAAILADALGLTYTAIPELGENDRSSSGYLPQKEFSAVVAEFFGKPQESMRGWERAVDAQARIVTAMTLILREAPSDGDVAIVAHGGVGTLLLCHLANLPISQDQDQPATNGGNYFAFDRATLHLIHGWRPG